MDGLAISSTAFRAVAYFFLRVVPVTWGKWLLPAMLFTYLGFYLKSPKPSESEKQKLRPPREDPWKTVVLSLRSASPTLNRVNLCINVLLFAFAVDLVVHPLLDPAHDLIFTRVGAVSADSIKLTVRFPDMNATEHTLKVLWRETPSKSGHWRDGPFLKLTQENDWVATAKISGLWPKTSYEYTLAFPNRTVLSYPPSPIQFKTFPDPRLPGSHFRFLFSSCVLPNFPYIPGHHREIQGFDRISEYLDRSAATTHDTNMTVLTNSNETLTPIAPTEFMLFLGDFIYSDVPFYFGDDPEAYTRLYRRNYASPSFRRVYERLPMFHTYDDHEFVNNYAGAGNDSKPPFSSATRAFQLYNADANPEPISKAAQYYSFNRGDVAFFVLDTRKYRSDIQTTPLSEDRTMLGEEQLAALHSWLGKVNSTATFKFIVSSVPFTDLWGWEAKEDSWPAYSAEKASLLPILHSIPNLVVLSGDRHEFAHIEINPSLPWQHTIREISTSPLNMFYVPFIRTLSRESHEKVTFASSDGTILSEKPKETALEYIAAGNSKFSAVEIDTRDLRKPILRLDLVIDGHSAYQYELMGTPVELRSGASALSAIVSSNIKDAFDKFGFQPTKWF